MPAPVTFQTPRDAFEDLLQALQTTHDHLLVECQQLARENQYLKSSISCQGEGLSLRSPQTQESVRDTPRDEFRHQLPVNPLFLARPASKACVPPATPRDVDEHPTPVVPLPAEVNFAAEDQLAQMASETSDHAIAMAPTRSSANVGHSAMDSSQTLRLSAPCLGDPSVAGILKNDNHLDIPNASQATAMSQGTAMSSTVSDSLEAWEKRFVAIFNELDQDGVGVVSTEVLRQAMVDVGVPRARLAKLVKVADADGSGEIHLPEWISAINSQKSGGSEFRKILRQLAQTTGVVTSASANWESPGSGYNKRRNRRWPRLMLNPASRRRILWDAVIALSCCYIGVVLPFSVVWSEILSGKSVEDFAVVERYINYLFMFDTLLNFRTSYYNVDDELVTHWRAVMVHYLRTWFVVDLVSCIPFNDVAGSESLDRLFAMKLLKLGKLLKLSNLLKLDYLRKAFGTCEVKSSVNLTFFSDLSDRISHSKVWRMIYRRCGVFGYMLLLCHWLACGMKSVDQGFLSNYQDVNGHVWSEYLAALYWAMTTLTTVGYGDIISYSDRERAYTLMTMVVGGAFYAFIVGSITSMVANNDLNSSAYYDRMDLIHAWLRHHRLPMRVKRKVHRYFRDYLSEKSAVNEADIWHDLSPELQKDVGQYIIHDDVKMNPLFDGMSISSVVRLQSILQRVTILSGSILTTLGEAGTAMYIVVSGRVQMDMQTPSGEGLVKTLGPGESFGEEILLGFMEDYWYTVTVTEKAKLVMILEDEFLPLFEAMPNVLERMRQNALDLNPEWDHKGKGQTRDRRSMTASCHAAMFASISRGRSRTTMQANNMPK